MIGKFVYGIGLNDNKIKKAAPPRILQQAEGLKPGAQTTFIVSIPQKSENINTQFSLENAEGNL